MRKTKRLAVLSMAALMSIGSVGVLSACGGNGGGKNDPNAVNIKAVNLGYGVEWLYQLTDAYTEANPDTTFNITPLAGQDGIQAIQGEMESLSGTTDIFFTRPSDFHAVCYQGEVVTKAGKFDCAYADLTDIWQSAYEGENGATMESKIDSAYAEYLNVNGKYYGVPWADGFMGIVRNKNVWSILGLTEEDVPLTTNEWLELCDEIKVLAKDAKNAGKTQFEIAPILYSKSEEDYTTVFSIWLAQYEGKASMANLEKGLDPIGELSDKLYNYKGQTVALEFIADLLTKENGQYKYHHKDCDSLDFTTMQSYFLLDQAAFCVNGSWLEIEMNKNGAAKQHNIDYIKAPVISALADKLSFANEEGLTAEAKDDRLAELVSFVDAHPTVGDNDGAPSYATEADVEKVREARQVSYTRSSADHTAIVTAYATHLEQAKAFLKYMYSDAGLNVYYKAQKGNALPATPTSGYENVEPSTFTKSVNAVRAEALYTHYGFYDKAKVYSLGGVNLHYYNGSTNAVHRIIEGDSVASIIADNQKDIKTRWTSIANSCR